MKRFQKTAAYIIKRNGNACLPPAACGIMVGSKTWLLTKDVIPCAQWTVVSYPQEHHSIETEFGSLEPLYHWLC
jgi:hypothetical protein